MYDNNQILDIDIFEDENKIDIELLSTQKFILLSILTFGIYQVWWNYKSWKFLKQTYNLDVNPVLRAIFGVLFLYDLFKTINEKAVNDFGYSKKYSSGLLYIIVLFLNLCSRIDSISLISIFSFIGYILPYQSLNYIKEHLEVYNAKYINGFNNRQIILIAIGSLLWISILYNMLEV